MANPFETYAKKRLKLVRRQLEAFETTGLRTGERRNGKRVDTTAETIAEYQRQEAELLRLLEKHGSANAKGT